MSAPRRCGGGRRPERAAVVGDNANGYVEIDPTGRYGRFDELLGKGAMKSVYRGFDEELGVEVAWNQASLTDVLRSPDAVERIYSEVQLLSELRHDAIIGFRASWVDVPGRSFNFITELFPSGTLRAYRRRYPAVSLRAVRRWARQLLAGLAYLHARSPPVIHRDLKCDNVFVHGHRGEVKIGDLGLAAVLRRAGDRARSVIGTPEFMAPEMYDEEYDERVDVYAFGMCVLEMITLEYPYGECSNPAQIFKKVTAGKLPDAFYRVEDDDARRFIGRCLAAATARPSAAELLTDPFLLDRPPPPPPPPEPRTTMSITGKLNAEEDTVFLKVQIAGDEGGGAGARNIYFPFDMVGDTAAEVAEEMVKELGVTDRDAAEIAAMIEQEIERLLPGRAQQHEYTYAARDGDDDDDDENGEERPPPFCYLSSSPTSSSQGSHCGVGPYAYGGFSGPRGGGWSKDDRHQWYALSDDDDMSSSSLHSGKYSPPHYAASSGDAAADEPPSCSGSSRTTRFGGGNGSSAAALARQLQRQCSMSPHMHDVGRARRREGGGGEGERRRMTRNRSMVDMRSQLLHRTLVEELNRRLFFNTVGAVENIGFRAPTTTSPSASSSSSAARGGGGGGGRRSSTSSGSNKQQLLDDKQRYLML